MYYYFLHEEFLVWWDLLNVYFYLDTVYEIDYSINRDMRDTTSYLDWYGKAERRLAVRTDER